MQTVTVKIEGVAPLLAMRKSVFFLFLFLNFALVSTVYSGAFEDGSAAFNRNDYKEAFRLWLPLAEQGDARAQGNIGALYANGLGVPEDDVEAVRWFRKAAEQGDPGAQNNLADMYANGEGTIKSPSAAVDWYYKAGINALKEGYEGYRELALYALDRINKIAPGHYAGKKLQEALYP